MPPDVPVSEPTVLREERRGPVAVLTMDAPARRNALSVAMRRAMLAAMERIESDRTVRAAVLTGTGGVFSSGGDISGMDVADLAGGRERFRVTHALVRALVKSSKPLVAAVEGWCVGAGLSAALCCDTVVAAEGARFGAPFGKVGLVADLGLLHTLPLRVGQGRARQMLLYGETIGAAEALATGLVDEVVPTGTALDRAVARAEALAALAPLPLAYTKQHYAAGLDALLDWERDVQSALFLTADHAEGKAAFLGKRPPTFTGA